MDAPIGLYQRVCLVRSARPRVKPRGEALRASPAADGWRWLFHRQEPALNAPEQAHHQGHSEKHEKNKKQHFRDLGCTGGDAPEPK
jgi:hypothetical protein